MAQNFYAVTGINGETLVPVECPVAAGAAATIEPGMSVTKGTNTAVAESANGAASSALIWGIGANTSTDTAGAAGVVLTYRAPVIACKCKATTPANLSAAIRYTLVTLDVAGTTHTVDENDTTTGWITILDYDNATDGNCIVQFPCRFVLWT